jgi:hypothetical protein
LQRAHALFKEEPMPAGTALRAARAIVAATAAVALLLLLLPAAAPAHRAPVTKRCASVPFTPDSDDIAADVRATGMSCAAARDLIRRSEGRPPASFRGFACTRRRVEDAEEMPYTRVRCVKGSRSVRWNRF